MSSQIKTSVAKASDSIQEALTDYAWELSFDRLTPEAIEAVKVRVVDTLGALIAGLSAQPVSMARNLAAQTPDPNGATIIGTRMKAGIEGAVFANCIAARYPELTDNYVQAGSFGGHPSDAITPLLSVAEYAGKDGRELIAAIILAYEVYIRFSDIFENMGFDHATFNCLGVAMGTGKLLGLTREQFGHCISMAIVPNNVIRQVRTGHMSMFKAAASGQAAKAGVFAALLARAGMEGPHLPFEGKAGWCDHVALKHFTIENMGGQNRRYRILDTSIKMRPCSGFSISSALAAEKAAPVVTGEVEHVTVETYERAVDRAGSGEQRWNPDTRETADHSIPYIVAATLIDGMVSLRSFDDVHLSSQEQRALMKKIEVVENPEFTKAFRQIPQRHLTRIIVTMADGRKLIGESGTEGTDLGGQKSRDQIVQKFRSLTGNLLGQQRVNAILDPLWALEQVSDLGMMVRDFSVE